MDSEKKIEIPFGAFDSELIHQEINIPNGFKAVIDGNKIILTRAENEDEKIRKALINVFATHKDYEMFFGVSVENIHAWLERQGKHAIACSEEQMKVLDEVLNFAANHESPYWNNYIFETLNNLIRQLKN